MSALTFQRRELKNVRVYFVPTGTVLAQGAGSGSLTVGPTAAFPDNDPTTNYTDFEFQDVEKVEEEIGTINEKFQIPANGAYIEDEENTVVSRKWTATSHKTNALLKQLQYGLSSIPVAGTPQAIDGNRTGSIDGVYLMEVQTKGATVIERIACWARLRLVSPGSIGPATAELKYSFQMLQHSANSFAPIA